MHLQTSAPLQLYNFVGLELLIIIALNLLRVIRSLFVVQRTKRNELFTKAVNSFKLSPRIERERQRDRETVMETESERQIEREKGRAR